jgi:hypothetical protein
MSEQLDRYLAEVGRYLVVSGDPAEILEEIRSHILERAGGGSDEAALSAAIAAYGSPRQVAAQYVEDYQIINPVFRNFFIRYVACLAAVHVGLAVLASVLGRSLLIIPFFFIPRLELVQFLLYLPSILLFDVGLVGLVFYFATQSHKEVRLPWISSGRPLAATEVPPEQSKKPSESRHYVVLAFRLLFLVGAGYLFLRFGTVFCLRLGGENFRPFDSSPVFIGYSQAVLAFLLVGATAHIARWLIHRPWVDLMEHTLYLLILAVVFNRYPLENPLKGFPVLGVETIFTQIAAVVTILVAIGFLMSVIRVVRYYLPRKGVVR